MHFKGVLIDFGGTLAYIDELENRRYEETLASALEEHGCKPHLEDLTSALASTYFASTKGELKTPQEFWSLVLKKLRVPRQQDLMAELEAIKDSHTSATRKLYEGVPAVLATLQKKYKLALVSNCAVGTDKLINALGLADFFTCTILSYQIEVRKPDKRMYLEALKCLELEAHECIFVADEISDLEGAKEIGLKTMLVRQGLNTFQEAKNTNFKPDFQTSQISEITKFL